jgi:hypothetical protein
MTRFGIEFFKSTIISDKNNLEETVFDIGSKILKIGKVIYYLGLKPKLIFVFSMRNPI